MPLCNKNTLVNCQMVNRRLDILLLDNSKQDTAIRTQKKIEKHDGIEHLQHPVYSPVFSSSDYHFFRYMAHVLKNGISTNKRKSKRDFSFVEINTNGNNI